MIIVGLVDNLGLYGSFMHYSFTIAFVGSAFLIFLFLWRKGKLSSDEEPKYKMMQDDDNTN